MTFPEHIERVFEAFGVPADTKNAIYDLYVAMGEDALDAFGEIAESVDSPANLRPEHTVDVRKLVVERYLTRNHPRWCEGQPTASLYRPRVLEGRASGLAIPLGPIEPSKHVAVGEDQPVPEGILMQSRNAHSGGREGTISFDLIPLELEDAIAIGQAAGQQHTLPGSVGETSGSIDGERAVALLWEIQPNVYKPAGERNRNISKLFRKHRNWHIVTLVAALDWLRAKKFRVYILRGEALSATHEHNPAKPVTETIINLYNRTVGNVTKGLGIELVPADRDDEQMLLDSALMNTALFEHVTLNGAADAIWRAE